MNTNNGYESPKLPPEINEKFYKGAKPHEIRSTYIDMDEVNEYLNTSDEFDSPEEEQKQIDELMKEAVRREQLKG